MIDGCQPAAFVDADGMGGEGAGDRRGGSDQQRREGNAVDAENPAPEARGEPAVGEEQDRDREHHEAGTPDLVQRHCHRGQGKVVPEMVGEERVASAVGADELADSTHEEEPAERVARLAPGNQHSDPRAGKADHRRYRQVGHLV
jgi:hypothetical protein